MLEQVIADREGDGPLVIDVGDVYFIDSSGLRSLLGASRRAKTRGSSVVLRSVGAEVSRLLEITGTSSQPSGKSSFISARRSSSATAAGSRCTRSSRLDRSHDFSGMS